MPVISIRFTDEDMPAIRAAAKAAGLSISAYVASCVPTATTLPTRGRPESRITKVRSLIEEEQRVQREVRTAPEFRGDITVDFSQLIEGGIPAWVIHQALSKMIQSGELLVMGWRLNGEWHETSHLPPRLGDSNNTLTLRRTCR